MTTCKCGLSGIYPVCDYKHFKITRNEELRQRVIDTVNEYLKISGSEEKVGIPQEKKDVD
jgi:CDGSH-type Zn-finger protein